MYVLATDMIFKITLKSTTAYTECILVCVPQFTVSNGCSIVSISVSHFLHHVSSVRICVLVPSSFLFRGHGSWLFNLITGDWWHQVQSCADLPQKPAAGISWDEEQWDSADQSERRSDRTRGRLTFDELLGADTFLSLLGIPPFNR